MISVLRIREQVYCTGLITKYFNTIHMHASARYHNSARMYTHHLHIIKVYYIFLLEEFRTGTVIPRLKAVSHASRYVTVSYYVMLNDVRYSSAYFVIILDICA